MTEKKDDAFEYNDESCGGCGCGCDDSDNEELDDLDYGDEDDIMYLTLDDDTELECNVLGIFEVEEKEYIALLPMGEEEVIIYEYVELEDEDFELLAIEEEEEFNTVAAAFDALFSDDDEFVEYGSYDDLEDEDEEE